MRCAVPLLAGRVAPRCTCAEEMLVVALRRGRVVSSRRLALELHDPLDLIPIFHRLQIDTVVCGGIRRDTRGLLAARGIDVIDNVACTADQVVAALESGELRPGFGFLGMEEAPSSGRAAAAGHPATDDPHDGSERRFDCLRCRERVCLEGVSCLPRELEATSPLAVDMRRMLEAAADVSGEEERTLCRLSEVIYFCLEMGFHRIGIAYCEDLDEPSRILAKVLERFFEVVPVCCKVGGDDGTQGRGGAVSDSERPEPACNPVTQARVLNAIGADLNVIVGLCVGADCVFARESEAPVTTLFVKDKSLANNPIGALYSDYYLHESAVTPDSSGGEGLR